MPISHAAVGGSAISRILRCLGSVKLAASLPRESSAAADRGTMLHYMLGRVIDEGVEPSALVGQVHEGRRLEAGDAKAMLVTAAAMLRRFMGLAVPRLEVRVKLANRVWGTADAIGAYQRTGLLADFKFGSWPVDPESEQNTFYAAAAHDMGLFGPDVREVKTVIIQPAVSTRLKPVTYRPDALVEFAAKVRAVAKVALGPNAPVIPGERQCEWCPVRKAGACPALNKGAETLAGALGMLKLRI